MINNADVIRETLSGFAPDAEVWRSPAGDIAVGATSSPEGEAWEYIGTVREYQTALDNEDFAAFPDTLGCTRDQFLADWSRSREEAFYLRLNSRCG